MENKSYYVTNNISNEKLHPYWQHTVPQGSSYSQEQYDDAISIWKNFVNYYSRYCSKKTRGFEQNIPCLELLVKIAPLIGDFKMVKELMEVLSHMTLPSYNISALLNLLALLPAYNKFYRRYITDTPQKQVDLVKILNEEIPEISGSLYFYVLKKFNLITVTKEGRYNLISNPNYIPYREESSLVGTDEDGERDNDTQESNISDLEEPPQEYVCVRINDGAKNIVVNYAMQQNGYSPITSVKFINKYLDPIADAKVILRFDPEMIAEKVIDFGRLAALSENVQENIPLVIKPSVLMNITEKIVGVMTVEIYAEGQSVNTLSYPVEFLAYNEWSGSSLSREMLAAFVTPNHPAVSAVLSSASKVLREWGLIPSFEGYQGDRNRVLQQMAAIYTALRRQKIVYNNPPASFEKAQRVKLPNEVLQEKKGTCLDLSVLYCACLEAAGMHPILFLQSGHAFAGCWLEDNLSFAGGICDVYADVTNKTAGNNCSIAMINSVDFCLDANTKFDESWSNADYLLSSVNDFNYVLDVSYLRIREGRPIRPIPLAKASNIDTSMFDVQEKVNIVEDKPFELEENNKRSVPEDSGAYAKQRYWEKKLLDLSVSNPLISIYKTRNTTVEDAEGNKNKVAMRTTSALEIIVPDISALEDRLADGVCFNLRPDFERCIRNSEEVGITYHNVLKNIKYDKNDTDETEKAEGHAKNVAINTFIESSFVREQLFLSDNINEGDKRLKNCAKAATRSLEENGANTLYLALGILRWFEEPLMKKEFTSEDELQEYSANYINRYAQYAPLLLIPVDLERHSLSNTFSIKSRQEETQINITLLEFLKQNFGIETTGLDPLPLDAHGVDLPLILNTIRNAVKDYPLWEIMGEAYLGHFSFAKFVMWNDIHNHAEEIAQNKVVNSLLHGARSWTPKCDNITEDKIESVSDALNMIVPSSADSSQMVAVATALSGESIVMQGPPGTGKSQTITNLIANALFNGKTVLFVAEKQAALDVVKRRLEGMGLGNFCLSMHSDDANKLSVLERLKKTIDFTYFPFSNDEYKYSVEMVRGLRLKLNEIINALHAKRNFGYSLYEAINILKQNIKYKNAIPFYRSALKDINQEDIHNFEGLLRDYKSALKEMGDIYDDTLKGYNGTEYSLALREQLNFDLEELLYSKEKVQESYNYLCRWAESIAYTEIDGYLAALSTLTGAKNCLKGVVGSSNGGQVIKEIETFLQALEAYKAEEAGCANYFDLRVLDLNIAAAKTAWEFGGNTFDGTRNRLQSELQSYAKPGIVIQESMMVYNYNYLEAIAAKRAQIFHLGERVCPYLGVLYKGIDTDIAGVRTAFSSTAALQKSLSNLGFSLNSNQVDNALGNSQLENAIAILKQFLARVAKFSNEYWIDYGNLNNDEWLNEIFLVAERIYDNIGKLRGRVAYNKVAAKLGNTVMRPVLNAVESGKVSVENLENAFNGSLYYHLVMLTVSNDSRLCEFYGMKYNEMIDHYREVIDNYQKLCLKELVLKLQKKVYEAKINANNYVEITTLYKSIMNKGRNKPIRRLFTEIKDILPQLCPCMLMNPISVAQYIDMSFNKFDLVIFDEASQIPTSEAVGAIARGKDAIIVGDPKQMPPTNFFGSTDENDVEEDIKDMESLLLDCQTIQMPTKELKWHYRSQHESLIAFSNAKYYDGHLYTFPTPNDLISEVKIIHPDGYYDRKSGTNKAEAKAIVEEIIRRYRSPELRKDSIGVIAFNTKQQAYIEEMLEKTLALPANSDLAEFNITKNVFVKNLENVQGDEADVILFSIGFAADEDGKILMNFGPLNRDGGWRRLNVAVSRSRKSMIIYSVLRPEDIKSTVTAQGVLNLKEFLAYAENRTNLVKAGKNNDHKKGVSYLIQEISETIKKMGYEVECNVGNSEFKMDIAVLNPYQPETYLMGIMLDSENCKEAATARDRFVLQPSILKGLGWKLVRLWTLDWVDDPKRVENQLKNSLTEEAEKAKAAYDVGLAARDKSLKESAANLSVYLAEVEPNTEEIEEVVENQIDSKPLVIIDAPEETEKSAPTALENVDLVLEPSNEELEVPSAENNNVCDEKIPVNENKPQVNLLRINRKGPRVYKTANINVQGTQSDYYNPDNLQKVADVLAKIMVKEAPININLLAERIMPLYSFNRTSTKFYNTLNSALDLLNTICTSDETRDFLWLNTQQPEAYDIYRDGADRPIEYIPAEEIVNAAYVSLKQNGPLYLDELARDVLNRFNGSKLTKKAQGVIYYALDLAEQEQVFNIDQNGLVSINRAKK